MPHIAKVVAVPAVGAYYFEDLAALQSNALPLAERYTADPVTPGFKHVREAAEGVSIGLLLKDMPGNPVQIAWGDCVAVAYSGKAGRDPVFRSDQGLRIIRDVVAPVLEGRELDVYRLLAEEVDSLLLNNAEAANGGGARRSVLTSPLGLISASLGLDESETPPGPELAPVHTAIRYGVGQALLSAVAMVQGNSVAEVVAAEWGLPVPTEPVPIHAQAGSNYYDNADKMIVRRVASLPHILIDDIPQQLGKDGAKLVTYVRWLSERIQELGDADYQPTIHIDVHGALGQISENNSGKILGRLYALEKAAEPYPLRVESVVILESREAQIDMFQRLKDYIRVRGLNVQLVADEWANTLDDIRVFAEAKAADMVQIKMPDLGGVQHSIDAVLACKEQGVGAFLGGSCAETDIAARIAIHIALATRPDVVMAKPGMGVDEAVMLAQNEMTRTLAWIENRNE